MNIGKKGVSILLAVLIVLGWGACVLKIGVESDPEETARTGSYRSSITLAEDYMKRGLYQKAAEEYENAVSLKDKEADWEALLKARKSRYEEEEDSLDDYLSSAKKAARSYRKNVAFCTTAAELSIQADDYSGAYRILEQAKQAGVEDKKVDQLYTQVKYSYEILSTEYNTVRSACNGYYSVELGGHWGVLTTSGRKVVKEQYTFLGPMNQDGIFVCAVNGAGALDDMDGVVQGKLKFVPQDAGVYGEELVPILAQNQWSYYNLLGDKQFGEYQFAGSFQDGVAAVQTTKGWTLIDAEGKNASDTVYQEISVNKDGSYKVDDVMLAKKEGSYHLFDKKENQIGDFACDDVDVMTQDGIFAFQKNGKWGFADQDGNEIIKAHYEKAKSFSNGLAAVCSNGKWGFINQQDELVIPCDFVDADYFADTGCCMVQTKASAWQLIQLRIWP